METLPFLADIYPENLLYAVTIRSPIAKGRLRKIETPELPDHFTFITAKDIPGENILYDTNIPILAYDKLSYIGEPVAILLGQDKTKLEEIAARCIVNVQEEQPVFSYNENNFYVSRNVIIGDLQDKTPDEHFTELFGSSDKVITSSFVTGIQEHWYAETIGAITYFSDIYSLELAENDESELNENYLIVRTATQWPYHVKKAISRVLGIDKAVMVIPTALNLHMDGKLWYPSLVACHAALGTFITKKPVRLILSREEDFLYTPKRCSSTIDISSAINDKSKITATQIDISVNLGAHGVNGREILDQICLGSIGLYNLKNVKLNARAVCTNIPPQGPFSGFGLSQGLYAIERHISQIADLLEIEPAEFRKNNINTDLALPLITPTDKNLTTGQELIEEVTLMSDYYRKWASCELLRENRKTKTPEKGEKLRGIGIAIGFQGNSPLYVGEDKGLYSVEVTLTKESILKIKTNITSSEKYTKIWQKVASEVLSIKPDMICIVQTNLNDEISSNELNLDCGPSCSSRNITVVTKLVEDCCIAICNQRFHDPLPITVIRSVKPQSGFLKTENWKVMDINGFLKPGLAAAVVEITIDLADCIPKIRGLWLVVDGGKIISKHRAKRNLIRASMQALGWAFSENIDYVNGMIPKEQYENFSIFSPVDTPPIEINFITGQANNGDSKDSLEPQPSAKREDSHLEPKGIGELPFTCIPAAFIQAVSQAMDCCFNTIPLKRNDIWEILRIRKDEEHK